LIVSIIITLLGSLVRVTLLLIRSQRYPHISLPKLLIQFRFISEYALHDAPQRVLPPPQVLLDRLRYDLQEYRAGVDQLQNTDGLDVVLNDQQGYHTGEQ
jgi:hypothetical protein